jgi:hypothetical protein
LLVDVSLHPDTLFRLQSQSAGRRVTGVIRLPADCDWSLNNVSGCSDTSTSRLRLES